MKQNKEDEITFFNNIIDDACEYDTLTDEFYDYFFNLDDLTIAPKSKILECGCGAGAFGKRFANLNLFLNIVGVDISNKMVEIANNCNNNYKAIVGDLENKNIFKSNTFDIIICPMILHHFPNISNVMDNLYYWLKDNGRIVIIEPNGSNPVNKLSKIIRHLIEFLLGKEYIMHHKLATPNETDHSLVDYKKSLKDNGYTLIHIETIHFPQRNVSLLSIVGVKNVMYLLSNRLLMPYGGSCIIIIAKK